MHHLRLRAAVALLASAVAMPAFGGTVGFTCITGNVAGNCAIGEAQLSLDVTSEGSNQVRFTFSNAGPLQSVISEIYIDDEQRLLSGIASIVNGTGVVFQLAAHPPNLPGGNLVQFEVTANLLAEAAPAPPKNGVGEGESVSIIFDLRAGTSFSDVLTRLSDGSLRAGIHVIAFGSGGSESFVNQPVPEPSAALLVLAGLGGVALRRARRPR